VILTLHWGVENHILNGNPGGAGEELLASPDIDLILGSHAHVVQPIGRVDGKVVVYGMGNHLSNQNQRWGPSYWSTEDGLMVHLTVTEQGRRQLRHHPGAVHPTWVEFGSYRVLPIAWAQAAGEGDPLP